MFQLLFHKLYSSIKNIIEDVRTEFNDVFLLKTRNITFLIVATTHMHNTIKISEIEKYLLCPYLKIPLEPIVAIYLILKIKEADR